MRIEPQVSAASIVLIGNFNPIIFQPLWFSKHELIGDAAAQNAEVAIINPEITEFSVEGKFKLRVERERFAIDRRESPLILISDLVGRIFGDLLPHTPVRQLEINRAVHFDVGSQDERDRIGILLTPREPWGEWGKLVSSGEGPKHGGMRSLSLIQRNVSDRTSGHIQAKVEPSAVIKFTGIYMSVNDHYDLSQGEDAIDAIEAARILQQRFDSSISRSDAIIDQIMSLKQ